MAVSSSSSIHTAVVINGGGDRSSRGLEGRLERRTLGRFARRVSSYIFKLNLFRVGYKSEKEGDKLAMDKQLNHLHLITQEYLP